MKIEFEKQQKINLDGVNYGDVLLLDDESKWLVVKDVDGEDFRAINLETYEITEFQSSIENLIEWELDVYTVKRIIKSEDLVLGVI